MTEIITKPTQSMFQDIRDFHVKFGLNYEGEPRFLSEDLSKFRTKFLAEELGEYAGARVALEAENPDGRWDFPSLEEKLDALVDLCYVAIGTAYVHGFVDFDEAWRRVHAANMQKVRVERPEDSARGSGFDVVKPKGWEAPDLSDLVAPR